MQETEKLQRRGDLVTAVGVGALRYGTVAILLMFGAAKWTAQEAAGIQPMMAHQPMTALLYKVASYSMRPRSSA